MSQLQTSEEVLEREFLPVRAKILEIAASLDRIQRAESSSSQGAELERIRTAIRSLLDEEPGRAEQIQLLFSREYEEGWRKDFGL